MDNTVNDNGQEAFTDQMKTERDNLLAKIEKLGGDVQKVRMINTYLWLGY